MLEKYRHYFNVDPEYFPQVNEAIINKNPDLWKKYYPHETFVKLLKDTVNVLSRKDKLSIWVEGAYGTGKSHAVLTLKKLLDANEEDTRAYFNKYEEQLDIDLFNNLQQLKSDGNKIITVHRYGSSSIHGDNNLVFAIQESIENALIENGIGNGGNIALKQSTIDWLSDDANKAYFDALITGDYADLFSGDNTDNVIEKLKTYTGESLMELMDKINKVADERQFKALSLDVNGLVEWIKSVIRENNLKAIVFIWDEFTNYFENNLHALTGFQQIVEISATDPFYMIIVTHKSAGLFNDTDKDQKRILDRFVKPTCIIELPENMAFRLMGAAMEKNQDKQVLEDWNYTADELYDRTKDSRQLVQKKARISDEELKNILPIHPYTALLLKHISSAFDSNQRSMFDFIKNDRGDEIKGFQWFIDNCSPEDDNPLLTVDMLWDFFYEKGKEYLSHDIRSILDCYPRATTKKIDDKEQRVLKAILLLQAISQKVGDTVDLFIPNEKNLNNAFEGSDLDIGAASRCADGLVRQEILYKKPLSGNNFQYSALIDAGDMAEVDKLRKELKNKQTSMLISEGDMLSSIVLNGALKLRYELRAASANDFKQTINKIRNQDMSFGNKIVAVITFAKDEKESATLSKDIKEAVRDTSYNIVFIDSSVTPMGADLLEQYIEAMANSMYQRGKDNNLATQYENNAKEVLKKWKNKIENGEFLIYTQDKPNGERVATIEQLYSAMAKINRKRFPDGLEIGAQVTDTMWNSTSLKQGVECGAKEETCGAYRSGNQQTKLENYMDDVWKVEEYWKKKPFFQISKVKLCVEDTINKGFKKDGRVSISEIYDVLKEEPYGFMSCNLTAFVMGFVLKEYANSNYSWSDGVTNDEMSIPKLKEMVDEVMKLQNTPNGRYKDKYIVTMTKEEKAFNDASSKIFGIQRNYCSSIEHTREYIRQKMKELSFPIWSLKYALGTEELATDKEVIKDVIDYYSGIANNSNFGKDKTDNDIAIAIGKLCIDNPNLAEDLSSILNGEKCTEGMDIYLHEYKNGELISLASIVGDNGQYINKLKKKFDADAAKWVWNVETTQQKIDEVILEYKIIVASDKVLGQKNLNFENTIHAWCDKCKYIRISYLAAKNYFDDLVPFMEMLYNIKKSSVLLDSQKEKFLELLKIKGTGFADFYNNQVELFKKVCEFYLAELDDNQIKELYLLLPVDCFTREKSDYMNLVDEKTKDFKNQLGSVKLKQLWKTKTGTDSPRVWSNKYKMPILCMVSDENMQKAKEAFGIINNGHADARKIEKAIAFIEKADFIDGLNNEEARDIAFKTNIIKSYDVMLDDIDEVKMYLDERITTEPYNWLGLPEVDKKLYQMAEAKYAQIGYDKALEKINNMDISEVKRYLTELIKDNMIVGMEIIKNK